MGSIGLRSAILKTKQHVRAVCPTAMSGGLRGHQRTLSDFGTRRQSESAPLGHLRKGPEHMEDRDSAEPASSTGLRKPPEAGRPAGGA